MKDVLKNQQEYERKRRALVRKYNRIAKIQHVLGIIASNAAVALTCYVIFKAMNLELPL